MSAVVCIRVARDVNIVIWIGSVTVPTNNVVLLASRVVKTGFKIFRIGQDGDRTAIGTGAVADLCADQSATAIRKDIDVIYGVGVQIADGEKCVGAGERCAACAGSESFRTIFHNP